MEWVMYTAAGVISGAPRPMSIPDGIRAAGGRPTLIIAGGAVADESAAAEDEKPAAQTAALPPVVDALEPVRTASATPPSVVEADDPGVGTQTPDTDISSRSEEAREGAERLIEFGREHKDEIRHAAHKLKEKIKEKLSDIKNHRHHDDAGQPLRANVKNALKGSIQRRLASR